MMFNIYGQNAGWQLLGFVLVFCGLVVLNEVARRTKVGGIACFVALPLALTVYFAIVTICAQCGVGWAQKNWTVLYMNSWFHYAKLYAATAGCIGFMMIKYQWGIGKKRWFKVFPFLIVAINILIAVGSDFESAIKGYISLQQTGTRWWKSSEGVWLYGGWWNWVNGIAGIINIACMTGWFTVTFSKDKKDMLWHDMTWVYIVAYDLWNFQYTYANLPTHSWYCGVALLLAPTFANFFWNKGGWIQNRANTLALWCMFAQVVPVFQDFSKFTTYSSQYVGVSGEVTYEMMYSINDATVWASQVNANPKSMGVVSILALLANVLAITFILIKWKKTKVNPWLGTSFEHQKDFQESLAKSGEEVSAQ